MRVTARKRGGSLDCRNIDDFLIIGVGVLDNLLTQIHFGNFVCHDHSALFTCKLAVQLHVFKRLRMYIYLMLV